jgi:hypothetical protein
MAYLGSKPQSGFISNAKERYTGITTAYVDLNHSIASLADVIVWVNFVKQDSTNLTLTSSTRITLGATLVSSDIVEVAYLGKAVATQNPSTNSITNGMMTDDSVGLAELSATGTASSSTFLRGDNAWASAGGDNTPYFSVSITSEQTVTNDTVTKVNFDRADVDSASGYDTTNKRYTIPSGQGGYWHIGYGVNIGTGSTDKLFASYVYPRKNGSSFPNFNSRHHGVAFSRQDGNPLRSLLIEKSFIANYSASDYIEIFANLNHTDGGSNTGTFGEYYSTFWGYRLVQ